MQKRVLGENKAAPKKWLLFPLFLPLWANHKGNFFIQF